MDTEMNKFKKGDVVECINSYEYQVTKGKTYEVTKDSNEFWTYVKNNDGNGVAGYASDRFKLVKHEDQKGCPPATAKDTQIGGTHYTKLAIQPFEYINANQIGFNEGTAIAYLTRWKDKGGLEDLRKAIHSIEWLIEFEEKKNV